MSIFTKLFNVQGVAVKKDGKAQYGAYMTLDNVIAVLEPILEKEKLLVYHFTENREVVTSVHDTESGEFVMSKFPLVETNDPQKYGSCITYAKRYNLGQIFNIITDEDDDGNKASEKVINYSQQESETVSHNASIKCKLCKKDLYKAKKVNINGKECTVYDCDVCKNDKGYPMGTFAK